MSRKLYVAISGLIGAGKSTLATALGKVMVLPVFYEPVIDNDYLTDFYKDPGRYGFPMQIFLLNRRFAQQQQVIWNGAGGVQDRSIYEDTVFCRMLHEAGHIDARDYATYTSLFENMSNFMQRPNLIVHLDVSPETSMERIRKRARDAEVGITLEYLQQLHAGYERFIEDISKRIPVIRVDYSQFRGDEEMAAMIRDEWARLTNVRDVSFSQRDSCLRVDAAEFQPSPRQTQNVEQPADLKKFYRLQQRLQRAFANRRQRTVGVLMNANTFQWHVSVDELKLARRWGLVQSVGDSHSLVTGGPTLLKFYDDRFQVLQERLQAAFANGVKDRPLVGLTDAALPWHVTRDEVELAVEWKILRRRGWKYVPGPGLWDSASI